MSGFTLHLLRHGEPEMTGRLLGRTDCPSTAAGIAACTAQVEGLAIEGLVTSDLCRAAAAADAIGARAGITPRVDRRWRELDFGAWDGLATYEIPAAPLAAFWDDPDANPPPQGEPWSALVGRIATAITELPPRPTLIVTHGGAMRAAVAGLCGLDHRQCWALDLPYAVLLTLQVWPGAPTSAQITGLRR